MITIERSCCYMCSYPLFKLFGYIVRIHKKKITNRPVIIPNKRFSYNIFLVNLSVHKESAKPLFYIIKVW